MSAEIKTIDRKTIEKLKCTLINAKNNLIDDEELFDYDLFEKTLDALSDIGKDGLVELKGDVYSLLDCWQEDIRAEAVATLGFDTRLGTPEFKDKAYEIWKNDPDSSVKATALSVWSGWHNRTYDKKVLVELYNALKNNQFDIGIRTVAYIGLFDVVNVKCPSYVPFVTTSKLMRSNSVEEFEAKIDWNAIDEIIKKYAPEALSSHK